MNYLVLLYILLFNSLYLHAQSISTDYKKYLNSDRITLVDENRHKSVINLSEYDKKPDNRRTYFWYTGQTVQQSQGAYSGKVLHGTFERFYPNKQLAQKGEFKKGLKKGKWKEWSTAGKLAKISQWKRSLETGNYQLFDSNGLLSEQGKYSNGKRDGKVQLFDTLSNKQIYQYYQLGKPISREDYIQQNIFRRSSNYLSEKWKTWFSKKSEAAQD